MPLKKMLIRRPAYLAVLLSQLLLSACGETPPAERGVTEALDRLGAAIEARDSGDVMAHLHEHFQSRGSGGAMDRDGASRTLMAVFYRHREIRVMLSNVEVVPDGTNRERASARFNALVTGGRGGILPDTAQLYRVESDWRLEDGEWQLLSLHAKRALEQ